MCALLAATADAATGAAQAPADCRPASDADFEGAGAEALKGWLEDLVQARGAQVDLSAQDVRLAIVKGPPKPGPQGVTAGEVACHRPGGGGPYRITLYRDALAGRPLATAYQTVAHEFQHVVQIRRDHLKCRAPHGELPAYEQEAAEVAEQSVPSCNR